MAIVRTPVVIPDNIPCLTMILAVSSCGFAAQVRRVLANIQTIYLADHLRGCGYLDDDDVGSTTGDRRPRDACHLCPGEYCKHDI